MKLGLHLVSPNCFNRTDAGLATGCHRPTTCYQFRDVVNLPAHALTAPPCAFISPHASRPHVPSVGEQDATAQWFEREVAPHERTLRAYLRMKFPHLGDVDDLIQEAYLRMLKARAAGTIETTKSYLFTIARNLGFDRCRHDACVTMEPLEEAGGLSVITSEPDAAEHAAQDNELALLTDAIAALPPRAREIITLRKLRQLSHREIAAQLGISEKTSMAHMNTGLAKVRDYLIEHGVHRQP